MRTLLLHIVFSVILSSTAYSQSIEWENKWTTFGIGGVFQAIEKTKDSNMIVCGVRWVVDDFPSYIIKYTNDGNIVWEKSVKLFANGETDIKKLNDTQFVYVGPIWKDGIAYTEILGVAQKISNNNGDTSSSIPVNNINDSGETPNRVVVTPDKGIAVLGYVSVQGNNTDFFVYKLDSLGNNEWYRTFGAWGNEYSCDIIINKKGNIVISGAYQNIYTGIRQTLLVELNKGETILSKAVSIRDSTRSEKNYRIYNNIIEVSDGYVFTGWFDSTTYDYGFVAKVDTAFNPQWYYTLKPSFSQYLLVSKVAQLKDSSLIILGSEQAQRKYHIWNISKTGQLISKKTFTSSVCTSGVLAYDWEIFDDSSIVIIGRCDDGAYIGKIDSIGEPFIPTDTCKNFQASFIAEQTGDSLQFINISNGGYAYAWQSEWKFSDSTTSSTFSPKIEVIGTQDSIWARLIATNPYGCKDTIAKKIKVFQITDTTDPIVNDNWKVIVYPNPSSDIFNFRNIGNNSTNFKLSLLNSIGQQVGSFNFNSKEFQLNANISDGMYFYLLTDDKGNRRTGKIIAE